MAVELGEKGEFRWLPGFTLHRRMLPFTKIRPKREETCFGRKIVSVLYILGSACL